MDYEMSIIMFISIWVQWISLQCNTNRLQWGRQFYKDLFGGMLTKSEQTDNLMETAQFFSVTVKAVLKKSL